MLHCLQLMGRKGGGEERRREERRREERRRGGKEGEGKEGGGKEEGNGELEQQFKLWVYQVVSLTSVSWG